MDPFKLLSRSTKLHKSSSSTGARVRHVPSAADSGHLEKNTDGYTDSGEPVSTGQKRKRLPDNESSNSHVPQNLDFFRASSDEVNNVRSGHAIRTSKKTTHQSQRPTTRTKPDDIDQEECRRILKRNRLKITLLSPTLRNEEQRKQRHQRLSGRHKGTSHAEKAHVQLTTQPLQRFGDLGTKYHVSKRLRSNLDAQGYTSPTEVQLGALPILLGDDKDRGLQAEDNKTLGNGRRSEVDLLTVAPTGSGKTLAFLIPLLHGLLQERHHRKNKIESEATSGATQALILAPTHELVDQIVNEGKKLAFGTGIRVRRMRKGMKLDPTDPDTDGLGDQDMLDGSTDGYTKDAALATPRIKADILVSTPALLLPASVTKPQVAATSLAKVRYLVLDEADVLLDPSFRTQTLGVWNACTNESLLTSLWSATIGSSVETLATAFILDRRQKLGLTAEHPKHHLVRLVVGLKDSAIPNISHQLIYAATESGKLMALRQLIHPTTTNMQNGQSLQPPFLVFTQSIPRAIALHSELLYDISAEAGGSSRIAVLHSGLSDTARSAIMAGFRKGEVWILITTDLLARGVDFRGVNGVVNYDIPNTSGIYIHRVGRTGRQGREGGVAVTLYTKEDVKYVKNVANVIAASEKQKGKLQGTPKEEGLQKWLLDALPDVPKNAKKELKKGGVEGRRTTIKETDGGKEARRMRISTKSGYDRR